MTIEIETRGEKTEQGWRGRAATACVSDDSTGG